MRVLISFYMCIRNISLIEVCRIGVMGVQRLSISKLFTLKCVRRFLGPYDWRDPRSYDRVVLWTQVRVGRYVKTISQEVGDTGSEGRRHYSLILK